MLLKLNKLYFLYKKNIFILNLFLSLNFIQTKGQETKWHFLLQNNNLNEFVQLNGKANFTLVNGVLTGTSKLNTPNSFLATKTKYSNFILEFDVLIDNDLNSGVQFRSESLKIIVHKKTCTPSSNCKVVLLSNTKITEEVHTEILRKASLLEQEAKNKKPK